MAIMKINHPIACLLGLALVALPAAAPAQPALVETVEASGIDLSTSVGRDQLDERLRAAVNAACERHSPHPSIAFRPGQSGKGVFTTAYSPSPREVCVQYETRKAHARRDRLVEQSALGREVQASR